MDRQRDVEWLCDRVECGESRIEIKGHTDEVNAINVSPDGTKIASGSDDETLCVWSLSTCQRLLGPLKHDDYVAAAKFSPDGRLIATATRNRNSVRVYDSQDGHLLVDVPIQVNSSLNRSLTWAIDGKQLFALSPDGNIRCLDPQGTTLSKWPIHSSEDAKCIALESTGTLIAASAASSVSFWNNTTRKQIGSVIKYNHRIWSMAISDTNGLVVCGDESITFTPLSDTPLVTPLTKTIQELPTDLASFQRMANQQKDSLCEIIRSLRADLHTQEMDTSVFTITLAHVPLTASLVSR